MKTHKHNGAVLPKTATDGGTPRTMRDLEAPVNPGYAFVGGSGWLGLACACGMYVSARTLAGIQAAILDHQESTGCAVGAAERAAEGASIDE